ncbi:hypothetical protein LIER_17976 [Lithospermum erythrorhizon]|uniref:J domain-containing protein n=1 Tax=Lithospermum erythrorhizon TaxID=34254 RepID=A0AAV3QCD2_LITER
MECNRDEAIKAKNLAERSMVNKDFMSARRFALKAQQLYPNLEDITKIILVCDVLCSGNKMVRGKEEKDWYAILKIEPTADEATIRKQYLKFSLSLHPDKNRFPGASDAFHLINEANRILLDRMLRKVYDLRLHAARSLVKRTSRKQSPKKSNPTRRPQEQNVNENVTPQCTDQQNLQDHQPIDNRKTFWTACTGCLTEYKYYEEIMGKQLHCRVCKAVFIAKQSLKKSNQTRYPQEQNVNENVAPQCTNQESLQDRQLVGNRKTFWTACTRCLTRYEYFKEIMGKQLYCRVCKAVFTALQINPPCSPDPSTQGGAGSLNRHASQNGRVSVQRENDNMKNSELEGRFTATVSEDRNPKEKPSNVEPMLEKMGSDLEDSCSKMASQREGEDAHSETNNIHIPPFNELFKTKIGTLDINSTNERPTKFRKLSAEIQKKRQRTGSISAFEGNSCGNRGPTHKKDVEKTFQDNLHPVRDYQNLYEYPAPEFSNFNDLRAQSVFEEGQIWAVYDTLDAMPRFYALISQVLSPTIKVKLIWLEPDPDDEEETKWVEEGLPTSCGKFRCGNSEVIQELSIFSHLVNWEKGSTAGTFEVHPMKGETWALYKDWDISWHAHSKTNQNYVYEFVEVLSDYVNSIGVFVAFLSKVEGFSCIFRRETKGTNKSFLILANERFRFSHRVPSFKITGKESKGVLAGSFELDPASLSFNMNESVYANYVDVDTRETHPRSLSSTSRDVLVDEKENSEGNESKAKLEKEGICVGNAPVTDFVEVKGKHKIDSPSQDLGKLHANSELEFYNFEENVCRNKFHIGQIWAVYCDEDSLPRYYCKIERIDPSPIFNLHVRWFLACSSPEATISWADDDMLCAVGNFKLIKGRSMKYSSTNAFSHLVRAEPTDENDVYSIVPKKGQIWALYKNWSPCLSLSNLDDCKYEIVEVVEENDLFILVSILKPVKGFKSVFRPQVEGQPNHAVEVSKTEILRFSHEIPAFQLTEELGGNLRGFWELDAAALPPHLQDQ